MMGKPRGERGQVLVEAAIAFPVQLLITLAIMQYCLVAVGKQVVNYAAHAAARAALVGEDPELAAAFVCSPIAGSSCVPGVADPIYVPGWGNLRRSHQSRLKTNVGPLVNPPDDGDKRVTAEVTHYLELTMPFVNGTPFADWHPLWGRVVKLGPRNVVHKVITQRVTLGQPWDGDLAGVVAHPLIPDLSTETGD